MLIDTQVKILNCVLLERMTDAVKKKNNATLQLAL
jgi:hypothetical protein